MATTALSTTGTDVSTQIREELGVALNYMKPRWASITESYQLLSNKTARKDKVSSKLMYTYFHTVLAAMYSDELKVIFEAIDPGDAPKADAMKFLQRFDFDQMSMAELDYEWTASTLIEGSSLLLMYSWDGKKQVPKPVVIEGTSLLRDPFAVSVRGNAMKEGMLRYFGRYIYLSRQDLEQRFEDKLYVGDIDDIKPYGGEMDVDKAKRDRAVALGYTDVTKQMPKAGPNSLYVLLEWFTITKGKLMFYTTNADATCDPIRTEELGGEFFPVVKRVINPLPGQWDGWSVCELVQDFHKHMNIVINGAMDIQKAGAYPRYLVNKNIVENQADLMKAHFNQYIFVDGQPQGAMEEVPRRQVSQDTQYIMNQLDFMAQRATATNEMQQGVQSKAYRSATEQSLVQQNSDTRYGLTAKVLTWSAKEFWERYKVMIDEHFSAVEKKMIRLKSADRVIWRALEKKDITAEGGFDIRVISLGEQAQERQRKIQALTMVSQELLMNPLADQQYLIKRKLELQGMSEDEIAQIFPPTADYYIAEIENEELSKNVIQKIHAQDDDYQHITKHYEAEDTPATRAHIKAHKISLLKKKAIPEARAMSKGSGTFSAQEQTVQPNTPNLPRMDALPNTPGANLMTP